MTRRDCRDDVLIWEKHYKGMAPSEIAAVLRITPTEAHDAIVARWKADKEAQARKRAM